MASRSSKSFKVDFFVVTKKGDRDHTDVTELLAAGNITQALPLDGGDEEKYQVRSIVSLNRGRAFKGVFGRCRFGEKPVQGNEQGHEADVELKPGHGLVEKNYFLFHSKRNLLVYQRNGSGSHHMKVQRYLNLVLKKGGFVLEPILTTDAYARLMHGSDARVIDISFQQPKDPSLYAGLPLEEAINLVQNLGGVKARMRISVGRTNKRLFGKVKEAAVVLAKHGLASVARVTLADEVEPIDLIADRIIETVSVPLQDNGRPKAEDVYAALQEAEDRRDDDLRTFYGR